MSASISSLLADELDTSPEQAQKLLIAMLREVKKRARREGVRLPEFGTFREANGEITFEPSPSLARAVNERFEGLESEDLGTAPESDRTQADEDDDGPSTITLGYTDSDWTPLDADADEADSAASEDDEEADTEEFQVPAAEEAADTEEFQTPDPAPNESASADRPSPDDGSGREPETETEELYPLVEDVSEDEAAEEPTEPTADHGSSSNGQTPDDKEHDSLSGIWDEKEEDEDPSPSDTDGFDPFDSAPDPASISETNDSAEPAPTSATDSVAAADTESSEEVDVEPDAGSPPSPQPASSDGSSDDNGSTGARVAVGLVVVLLLGGAAWYVLGQRGTVQPPRTAFAQLKTQIQPHMQNLAGLVGSSSDTSPPSATAEVSSDQQTGADTRGGTDATTSASTEPTSDASSPDAPTPSGLTPSAGGWTIVVASRTQRGPAESLVEKYHTVFEDRALPVGILEGQVDGQTRYRVGVGQFDSQGDAQRLLDEAGATLPEGAWVLRLQ